MGSSLERCFVVADIHVPISYAFYGLLRYFLGSSSSNLFLGNFKAIRR